MDDFKDTVQDAIDNYGEYCLKPNDATAAPTASNDGNPCGSPEYIGDGQCDDDNNNADCGFDGGDCCPGDSPPSGWDDFCEDCTCLSETGASCCDTIETYANEENSDISFFAYGTWTKMTAQVNGRDAYVNDADDTKVLYYGCSGSWRIYESSNIGECNGYIFKDVTELCPHSEPAWAWSYWDGELGQGLAVKCTCKYYIQLMGLC